MPGKRRFNDQVVIVTGASSGLGFALAKAFAREGAATVLAARSADALQRAVEEIQNLHSKTLAIPTDVSLRADVENLVERTIAQFGRIDILINNAGSAYGGLIEDAEFIDNLRKMLDVSLYGKVYAVQAVLPVMKRQQAGHSFGDFVMRLLEHQTVTRILGLYNGRGLDRHGNPKKQ
jgi:NADP-dependent 3-hydroxy acid dehydrogenase YdfG